MSQAAPASGSRHRSCRLETGRLDVEILDNRLPQGLTTEALFGFAERINPRRAFLFVSRVLGRHIPVAPARMRQAFTALADQIAADLPGPVLITGMAETAVGLGAGVHDAYLARTGRRDVVYLATTRHRLGPIFARFTEDHSHASGHLVHQPADPALREMLAATRSLVMVDDEASSGATFANLAASLRGAGLRGAGLPRLSHLVTAVLTDWSDPDAAGMHPPRGTLDAAPLATARHALLRGAYRWTADPDAPARDLPDADLPREHGVPPLRRAQDGRLGYAQRLSVPARAVLEALAGHAGPVHVLGTGEHVWEPFLLAEGLAAAGHNVTFSSTTRSPVLPGHAIRSKLTFRDHEGIGIANYLYNVVPSPTQRVVLCCDTAVSALDPHLIATFKADLVVGREVFAHADLPPAIRTARPLTPVFADDAGEAGALAGIHADANAEIAP
ncbi:MAG: phosphoribosyltransferase domain-containing protein [Pseudomonadota bacterium]